METAGDDVTIDVRGLSKTYPGGIEAVKGVSFQVRRGEVFGFLGPNGAGKSTTIMMLMTLIRPTSGVATVNGFNIIKDPYRVRMQLGYVSQDLAVDDNLTGRENLRLQAGLYHLSKEEAEARISEVLELVGLRERCDDRVESYSGGMRKRLDIACGLIHRPRILFLDEPTLGLDIQTRHEIWRHIERLRSENEMTIFLTTHYMDEADALCDRIAIIDRGVIKAIDSPATLKSQLGGDVIYLRFDAACEHATAATLEALKELPEIKEISPRGEEHVVVARNGDWLLPRIFETAQEKGARINSVSLKRPTLDDVYLAYTGRTLRDGQGSREEAHRQMIAMRRIRK
ncbi:MAG: ATP-binding cassette domain-containing protein [Bacillota bacterium]